MQTEEIKQILTDTEASMKKAIEHLQHELAKVRTGKASTLLVNDILVDYYGSPTPMNQVASVTTSDARTIAIQPWEKNMLATIEKAIFSANIGITPMNDGEIIRLSIPPLTEERRKDLVKQVKHYGEDGKISLRNARHKALDGIKKAVKEGYSEDLGKRREGEVQDMINNFAKKVDALVETKEKDVMTV